MCIYNPNICLIRAEIVGRGSVSQIDPVALRSAKTSSFSRERPKTARVIKEEAVQEITPAAEEDDEQVSIL